MAAHAPGKRKALEGIKTVSVEEAPPSKKEGSDNESKLGGAQNWAQWSASAIWISFGGLEAVDLFGSSTTGELGKRLS
jgi:hypothetical protein